VTRDLTTDTQNAAAADTIQPILLAKLEFDGGDLLAHTGLGDIAFAGDTYTGVGQFGGIDTAEENSDLSSSNLTLTPSNIPGTVGSIVLNEHYQGRRATVYLGYLDLTTCQLIADPTILHRGRIDNANIRRDQTFVVSLSVQNRFAAWDKPLVRRYNDATQQAEFPGDTGMQFIEQTVGKTIVWGGT
jgi:hypothetical protein